MQRRKRRAIWLSILNFQFSDVSAIQMRKHVGGDWIGEGEVLQFGPRGAIPSPKKRSNSWGEGAN